MPMRGAKRCIREETRTSKQHEQGNARDSGGETGAAKGERDDEQPT